MDMDPGLAQWEVVQHFVTIIHNRRCKHITGIDQFMVLVLVLPLGRPCGACTSVTGMDHSKMCDSNEDRVVNRTMN
jgi:hypothetical protein